MRLYLAVRLATPLPFTTSKVMFGLVKDGALVKWPIGINDLKKEFPYTSFNTPFSLSDYAHLGVVEIFQQPPPSYDYKTQKITLSDPVEQTGAWFRTWTTEQLTTEEIAEITEQQASGVRSQRNAKLADCDWTQLADSPLSPDDKLAWQLYRETLRMVPEQPGFPWEIQWPPVPGS